MKIKGLIILSIICIVIMVLVLLATPPTSEITPGEKKSPIPGGEQMTDFSPMLPAPITVNTTIANLNGITIIKKNTEPQPSAETTDEITATENIYSQNIPPPVTSSSIDNSKSQDNLQTGITKLGKQPTHKESQEMNSQGIVLY